MYFSVPRSVSAPSVPKSAVTPENSNTLSVPQSLTTPVSPGSGDGTPVIESPREPGSGSQEKSPTAKPAAKTSEQKSGFFSRLFNKQGSQQQASTQNKPGDVVRMSC